MTEPEPAWVCHVDLDEFIAAVEVLRRPELAGQPVVVGGTGDPTRRSVVATASYAAREFGVRSGMPMKVAARKLPDAVFLPADNAHYEAVSAQVMAVIRELPGVVLEPIGWDEAFVGISTADPEAFARELQQAGAGRDRAVVLGRHRRHHPAGQDRHRLRQAARGVPADPWRTGTR